MQRARLLLHRDNSAKMPSAPYTLVAVLGLSIATYCVASAATSIGSADEYVQKQISTHKVQVFSKSYCPFCKNAKSLLSNMKVEHNVDELNEMNDGDAIQNALMKLTGQRTVPNIFIGGKHVGGNSDLVAAKDNGSLAQMLKAANVEL